MKHEKRPIELIDDSISEGIPHGVVHLQLEDETLDGRSIRVSGETLVNFASCSYLGLELDPRLRAGAIDAVERYGVQFSCSRAYLSAPGYTELEGLLDRIFESHTLVTPNTTIAHFCALPVLVEPGDAVILDQCVHSSVQLAASQLRLQGTRLEVVRSGHIEQLDALVRKLAPDHRRVFYLCDGIYSMYGEEVPLRALSWLLERHPALHLYVDDAHGMSWTGRNGRGVAAEHFGGHERVSIAVSLNKGFGAAGGALVFPDPETRRKVRTAGLPMIFTGPIQPPMLGAAIASARIHLSPEIETLQAALRERIELANRTARELDVPVVREDAVPIRFLGTSAKQAMFGLARGLRGDGYLLCPASFPAVGSRQNGMRATVTVHQRPEDIVGMLESAARHLPAALEEAGITRADVDRAFGVAPRAPRTDRRSARDDLTLETANHVRDLDTGDWDDLLADRGHDAATLEALEEVFGADADDRDRWRFHYQVVRDAGGRPVAASFFTEALWKDDILAAARLSRMVEARRRDDPTFLSSRVLAMGTLISEGDHLHLDRGGPWRPALLRLLAAAEQARAACGSPALVLRDLPAADAGLAALLGAEGFLRLELPDALELEIDWQDHAEFLAARSKRERRFHREQVAPYDDAWRREILEPGACEVNAAGWAHLHGLYRNVHGRQLALNTFPLPPALLPRLLRVPGWELIVLRPASGEGDGIDAVRGFALCQDRGGTYAPLLVGMDYGWVESHGLYRQLLAHCVARAKERGARRVAFGLGSELEKRRFGARPVTRAMYVQSHDRYHQDVLALIAAEANLGAEA